MRDLHPLVRFCACIPVLVVAVAGAGAVVDAPVGDAGAAQNGGEPTLSLTDVDVTEDETATAEIRLSAVPDGLSGFNVTVAATGDGVRIVDGAGNDTFGLTNATVGDDGDQVTIKAADLEHSVEPGDGPVQLATVTVRGNSTGETVLEVTANNVDDDDGNDVALSVENGTATVSSGSVVEPSTLAAVIAVLGIGGVLSVAILRRVR